MVIWFLIFDGFFKKNIVSSIEHKAAFSLEVNLCNVSKAWDMPLYQYVWRTIHESFYGWIIFEIWFQVQACSPWSLLIATFRFCAIPGLIEILPRTAVWWPYAMHLATVVQSNQAFHLVCVWQTALIFLILVSKAGVSLPVTVGTKLFPLDK